LAATSAGGSDGQALTGIVDESSAPTLCWRHDESGELAVALEAPELGDGAVHAAVGPARPHVAVAPPVHDHRLDRVGAHQVASRVPVTPRRVTEIATHRREGCECRLTSMVVGGPA
jgi:hypothetical protein